MIQELINGIFMIKESNFSIFYIQNFSDELKEIIRKHLSPICHGVKKTSTNRLSYSYKITINEFLERYKNKTNKQKKGLIGELLFHILIKEFVTDFTVNTPFFNIEERNVKKGFDAVLNKNGTTELWIAEVKSGEVRKDQLPYKTAVSLLNTAKNDLKERFLDSYSLWQNAINGAMVAIAETRSEKEAFLELLNDFSDKAVSKELKPSDINVILVGTVFGNIRDKIDSETISKKYEKTIKENIFKNVYFFVIQKNMYELVVNFLEKEGKN